MIRIDLCSLITWYGDLIASPLTNPWHPVTESPAIFEDLVFERMVSEL